MLYVAAGQLIEEVDGRTGEAFVKEEILEPAGMLNTTSDPEQRFASAQQMAEAFQALLSHSSQLPLEPQPVQVGQQQAYHAHTAGAAMALPNTLGTPQGLAVTTAPDKSAHRSLAWVAVLGGLGLAAALGTAAWWFIDRSPSAELASSAAPAPADEPSKPKAAAEAPAVEPSSSQALQAAVELADAPSPAASTSASDSDSTPPSAQAPPRTAAFPKVEAKKSQSKPAPAPAARRAPAKPAAVKADPVAPARSERDLFEDRL